MKLRIGIFLAILAAIAIADQFSSNTSTGSSSGGTTTTVATLPWLPPIVSPIADSNWTLDDGCATSATKAGVTGGEALTSPTNSGAGTCLEDVWTAAPTPSGTAFTATVHLIGFVSQGTGTAGPRYGIVIGDTGTKRLAFEIGCGTAGSNEANTCIDSLNFSTPFSVATVGTDWGPVGGFTYTPDIWMRIVYDGVNIKYQLSPTGTANTFLTMQTKSATSFLATAPAKIGFQTYPQANGSAAVVVLTYWSVTTP